MTWPCPCATVLDTRDVSNLGERDGGRERDDGARTGDAAERCAAGGGLGGTAGQWLPRHHRRPHSYRSGCGGPNPGDAVHHARRRRRCPGPGRMRGTLGLALAGSSRGVRPGDGGGGRRPRGLGAARPLDRRWRRPQHRRHRCGARPVGREPDPHRRSMVEPRCRRGLLRRRPAVRGRRVHAEAVDAGQRSVLLADPHGRRGHPARRAPVRRSPQPRRRGHQPRPRCLDAPGRRRAPAPARADPRGRLRGRVAQRVRHGGRRLRPTGLRGGLDRLPPAARDRPGSPEQRGPRRHRRRHGGGPVPEGQRRHLRDRHQPGSAHWAPRPAA